MQAPYYHISWVPADIDYNYIDPADMDSVDFADTDSADMGFVGSETADIVIPHYTVAAETGAVDIGFADIDFVDIVPADIAPADIAPADIVPADIVLAGSGAVHFVAVDIAVDLYCCYPIAYYRYFHSDY
jgi:hypothetical protein